MIRIAVSLEYHFPDDFVAEGSDVLEMVEEVRDSFTELQAEVATAGCRLEVRDLRLLDSGASGGS
jgi:hypothetical protein